MWAVFPNKSTKIKMSRVVRRFNKNPNDPGVTGFGDRCRQRAGGCRDGLGGQRDLGPIDVDASQSIPLTGNVNVTVGGTLDSVTRKGSGEITGGASGRSNASRGESAPFKSVGGQ